MAATKAAFKPIKSVLDSPPRPAYDFLRARERETPTTERENDLYTRV